LRAFNSVALPKVTQIEITKISQKLQVALKLCGSDGKYCGKKLTLRQWSSLKKGWVRKGNYHVKLNFLRDVEEKDLLNFSEYLVPMLSKIKLIHL